MKNIIILLLFCTIAAVAILKGTYLTERPAAIPQEKPSRIPYIGRVQILNGCGTKGVANDVASYLRARNFDVKNIGNAENWNYSETLVISRTIDTTIAALVAAALSSDKMVLIRNQETRYDVTVIVGNDYRERIK